MWDKIGIFRALLLNRGAKSSWSWFSVGKGFSDPVVHPHSKIYTVPPPPPPRAQDTCFMWRRDAGRGALLSYNWWMWHALFFYPSDGWAGLWKFQLWAVLPTLLESVWQARNWAPLFQMVRQKKAFPNCVHSWFDLVLTLLGHVAALVRSHMNGLIPFERTIEQTTETTETLRSRFFGISREPRTLRSHVTSALAWGFAVWGSRLYS